MMTTVWVAGLDNGGYAEDDPYRFIGVFADPDSAKLACERIRDHFCDKYEREHFPLVWRWVDHIPFWTTMAPAGEKSLYPIFDITPRQLNQAVDMNELDR